MLQKDTDNRTRQVIHVSWTPNDSRPKINWRRIVKSEFKMLGYNWESVEVLTKDRVAWTRCVDAL